MAADEKLDIYDASLQPVGVRTRAEVHREGLLHRTFHCWVTGQDAAGNGWLVYQLRGPHVEIYPNLLDITAAGHYTAGESAADGVREMQEELGLTVTFDQLTFVGNRASIARIGTMTDICFNDVFFLRDDRPLTAYQPDPGEVAGIARLPIRDGLALASGAVSALTVDALLLNTDNHYHPSTLTVSLADFVPSIDRYTLKALLIAERFLRGETLLFV